MLKQYGAAHSCVGDIIAKGIKEHPGTSLCFHLLHFLFECEKKYLELPITDFL